MNCEGLKAIVFWLQQRSQRLQTGAHRSQFRSIVHELNTCASEST